MKESSLAIRWSVAEGFHTRTEIFMKVLAWLPLCIFVVFNCILQIVQYLQQNCLSLCFCLSVCVCLSLWLSGSLSLCLSICTLTQSHTPTLPHNAYHLYLLL